MKNQKAGEKWQKAGAQEIGSKTRRSPVKSRRMATLCFLLLLKSWSPVFPSEVDGHPTFGILKIMLNKLLHDVNDFNNISNLISLTFPNILTKSFSASEMWTQQFLTKKHNIEAWLPERANLKFQLKILAQEKNIFNSFKLKFKKLQIPIIWLN